MIRNLLILALLAAPGCAAYPDEPAAPPAPMTKEAVSAAAKAGVDFVGNDHIAARKAANPDLLLVDVRTRAEYDLGRIPGAVWIPRGSAEFKIAETVRAADREIILYCKTGSRAALVKKALDAQGYLNVSAHQGFDTWIEADAPIETDLGTLQLLEAPAGD